MFKIGAFKSHAGLTLDWKVECDDCEPEDWEWAAMITAQAFPFKKVIGIPNGGLAFEAALKKYEDPSKLITLLVDDVVTTGKSFEDARAGIEGPVLGVALYARNNRHPIWVHPIWRFQPVFGARYRKPKARVSMYRGKVKYVNLG